MNFWTKFTQKRYFQSKTEEAVEELQAFGFYIVNVNSAVVVKHFEGFKDLIIVNIEKKIVYALSSGLFLS